MTKSKLLKLKDLDLPFEIDEEIQEEDDYYWRHTQRQLKEEFSNRLNTRYDETKDYCEY